MTAEKNVDPEGKQICARSLVIISTLSFLFVGAAVIACGILANNSGWLDVFNNAQFTWLRVAVFGGMIGLGCVIILIGLSGCVGATYRKRGFLIFYNVFLVIGLVLFGLVMGLSFYAYSISSSWTNVEYPADAKEIFVAETFNEAFCYAEASRFCNEANIEEIASVFSLNLDDYKEFLPDINDGGVNALCSDSNLDIIQNSAMPDDAATSIENTCEEAQKICNEFDVFEIYNPVTSEFFAKQCPDEDNIDIIAWCGNLIMNGEGQEDPSTGPYGVCRSPFLNFWSDTTKLIGIVLAGFLVLLLVVVISSCMVARRKPAITTYHEGQRRRQQSHYDEERPQSPGFAKTY